MSVYVDDMKAAFGRMKMCHMVADSNAELLAMVDRIGVARKWIQAEGTSREHFDIALSKRAEAVKAGAVEITMRQLAMRTRNREGPNAPLTLEAP
ncbi:MAG TPA: DUF4031 domain-containing protein [Gemmatimonadales bacterium]|nr:DUF4031 domain-containing protein [Gemmatimonadales bacterium]